MKVNANDIRAGNVLVMDNCLFSVTKQPEHIKPGKGPAYVQVEMKNLTSNTKVQKRFRSADVVEKAHIEEKKCQFLYQNENSFFFMDLESFEQFELNEDKIGTEKKFLLDGIKVAILFYMDNPILIVLPNEIVATIQDTPPSIKGATAKASYKKAIISESLTVSVPPYLNNGDDILIKTSDGSFVEKVK
ncbi:elongation factor P [Candidatus Sneabacter namystus]|nr:elongation factor P [Candidatus Sneabacter namystus]